MGCLHLADTNRARTTVMELRVYGNEEAGGDMAECGTYLEPSYRNASTRAVIAIGS
jgi:hypothetical protein